jgi:hypothetical protein
MAIIWVDGFPYTTTELFQIYSTNESRNNSVNASGRYGSRYIGLNSWGPTWIRKPLGANPATVIINFVFYSNAGWAFYLEDSGTEQIHFQESPQGTVIVQRGSTTIGTSSIIHANNAWIQFEAKCTINNSTGSVTVKLDGTTAINVSSQNTRQSANNYCNAIRLYGYTGVAYFSDLIVMDTTGSYCNDFIGPRRIQLCAPTADGNYKQSTPSTGTDRYATVDEIGPSNADYNTLAAAGDTDTFVIPDVGSQQNKIDAVFANFYGKTADAGIASLKLVARHSSTDGYGGIVTMTGSSIYNGISVIYVNPSTGSQFTRTEFNAAEFGYKREA